MNPAFKSGDILEYAPVGILNLKKGDVIVFSPPAESIRVVHRVNEVLAGKVRTRGDNNPSDDPYDLSQPEILGKVYSLKRGRKCMKVRNGALGRIQAAYRRNSKSVRKVFVSLIRPLYWYVSERNIISRWSGASLPIRVTEYARSSGIERYATLYGFIVAHLPPGSDQWSIYPPYRIIIDDSRLSSL